MSKWYEENHVSQDIIVASRIRLLRNVRDHVFPAKMESEERKQLTNQFLGEKERITQRMGRAFDCLMMDDLSVLQKQALKERMVINQAVLDHSDGVGILLSSDEAISITCNANDHLRILVNRPGMKLMEAWMEASRLDDCFNERYAYAFDEKLGYMTSFPTNLGTGMRAYVVLHLPLLSANRKFQDLIDEVSRYGLTLKKAFGDSNEALGAIFVLCNQKTLGISEKDIIQITSRVAQQLAGHERYLREYAMEQHQLQVEDEAYKRYGILKYARLLSLKDALTDLSQLRWVESVGGIELRKVLNCYEMMLQVQDATLQVNCNRTLSETERMLARADWIRKHLPEAAE